MKYIIISIAFILSGCGLSDAIIEQLLGTANQNEVCEEYEHVSDPQFVGFYTTLDVVPPTGYNFFADDQIIDLYLYLSQYGETTIYFNGVHIAGFVKGTNSIPHLMDDMHIFAHNGNSNAPINIIFGSQFMYVRGALNFIQFLTELTAHPSVRWLSFSGMTLSCPEVDQIMDFLLADCKETPDYIDARAIISCLSQETIDELELRGSTVRIN